MAGLRWLVGVLSPKGQLSGQLCGVDDEHVGLLSVGFTTGGIPLERGCEAARVAVPVLVHQGTVLAACYHRWELERLSPFPPPVRRSPTVGPPPARVLLEAAASPEVMVLGIPFVQDLRT